MTCACQWAYVDLAVTREHPEPRRVWRQVSWCFEHLPEVERVRVKKERGE